MALAFVTGASGFIGSHLVEGLLERGDRVRCLVRKCSQVAHLRKPGIELIQGNLDHPQVLHEALYGVNTVYHLAAMTAALDVEEMTRVNRDGCLNIAKAASQQRNPAKLILVSSIAAAGPAAKGQIRTEADPVAPVSNYGRTKLAGEQAALQYAGQVPMTIVRPGIVFGPRNRQLLPVFKTIKYLNIHPVPGYHSPPLSYIHVEDLVELLLRTPERGRCVDPSGNHSGQGCYFAVVPEYPSYADLGRMIARQVRRPLVAVVPLLGPFPWMVAGFNECVGRLRQKPFDLNFDKMREAWAPSWACSAEAAKRDLAFGPPKTLEERLAETTEWYHQEKWL